MKVLVWNEKFQSRRLLRGCIEYAVIIIYCNSRLYYLRLEFFDVKFRIVMFADLVIVKCTTKNVNTYVYVNAYI